MENGAARMGSVLVDTVVVECSVSFSNNVENVVKTLIAHLDIDAMDITNAPEQEEMDRNAIEILIAPPETALPTSLV